MENLYLIIAGLLISILLIISIMFFIRSENQKKLIQNLTTSLRVKTRVISIFCERISVYQKKINQLKEIAEKIETKVNQTNQRTNNENN